MMMTFFVEHHGYYMDQELMASCSGYVRDSFVMASLEKYSEYEHLEKILMDAVCEEPIFYDDTTLEVQEPTERSEKYKRYQKKKYEPQPHYKRDD